MPRRQETIIQAIRLINLCATEYQDTSFARISKTQWLDWLNDAQRNVVLVRPEANVGVGPVGLEPGTRHSISGLAGALRILGVTRNMGTDGATPGRAIRLIEREAQDSMYPGWHTAPLGAFVREVFYDDKKSPLTFWTRPGVRANDQAPLFYIEILYSRMPEDVVDADGGAITLSDIYAGPMQMWMLHRAFSLATQALNNFNRASFYLQSFFSLLGVKLRADIFQAASGRGTLPTAEAAGG